MSALNALLLCLWFAFCVLYGGWWVIEGWAKVQRRLPRFFSETFWGVWGGLVLGMFVPSAVYLAVSSLWG
jgi:hypothetical protein